MRQSPLACNSQAWSLSHTCSHASAQVLLSNVSCRCLPVADALRAIRHKQPPCDSLLLGTMHSKHTTSTLVQAWDSKQHQPLGSCRCIMSDEGSPHQLKLPLQFRVLSASTWPIKRVLSTKKSPFMSAGSPSTCQDQTCETCQAHRASEQKTHPTPPCSHVTRS